MAKKKKSTKVVSKPSSTEARNGESTAVVPPGFAPISITAKVCRLCEAKEGPYLNIFDSEKVTAKKIEDLMPFVIAENDELPHKICFRCSAKVEELHEFVQKCIKTQENLNISLGKKGPLVMTKAKTHRTLWEEKLNKSNITNDDICDAVVKKAMESIKDIPLQPLIEKNTLIEKTVMKKIVKASGETSSKTQGDDLEKTKTVSNNTNQNITDVNENKELKEVKTDSEHTPRRSSRSNTHEPLQSLEIPNKSKKTGKTADITVKAVSKSSEPHKNVAVENETSTNKNSICQSVKSDKIYIEEKDAEKPEPKPFNIMDHVNKIKVNRVGVLFQCKLCNRNFLTKEVVLNHWCAKNGAAKEDFTRKVVNESSHTRKVTTVKYINTKLDGESKKVENSNVPTKVEISADKSEEKTVPVVKPKPRIGPASKVKRFNEDNSSNMNNKPSTPPPVENNSSVQFPVVPNLNSHYKLVAGPNNTFTLVEANVDTAKDDKKATKRKLTLEEVRKFVNDPRKVETYVGESGSNTSRLAGNIIEVDEERPKAVCHPYPVGLIQTVSRHATTTEEQAVSRPPPFTTSAQKKQSYQIIQTNHPNKLLISAKAQVPEPELPKKRQKKVQEDIVSKQPYRVVLEDNSQPKDPGFFTFVNVDPMLQPSYVLPIDNIGAETPISTPVAQKRSKQSGEELYSCNMCNEQFTREQKLLAHIHAHYNKLDQEGQSSGNKLTRKRGKKS